MEPYTPQSPEGLPISQQLDLEPLPAVRSGIIGLGAKAIEGAQTFLEKVKTVIDAGREGWREARIGQKIGQIATTGAMLGTLGFEWLTGNEALIGVIGGRVLQATHNTLLTALAAGGVSFTEQSLFGLTAAAAVANVPRVTRAIRETFFSGIHEETPDYVDADSAHDMVIVNSIPDDTPEHARGSLFGRFTTAFAFGTAVPTILRSATQERTFQENARDVLIDSALIGAGVVALAGVVGGLTNLGEAAGWQEQTHIAVEIISSPYTYAALFGAKLTWDGIRKVRADRSDAELVEV